MLLQGPNKWIQGQLPRVCEAHFKRRTLHVPNLMQMSENKRFISFALDSAHVKFDVWNRPELPPAKDRAFAPVCFQLKGSSSAIFYYGTKHHTVSRKLRPTRSHSITTIQTH